MFCTLAYGEQRLRRKKCYTPPAAQTSAAICSITYGISRRAADNRTSIRPWQRRELHGQLSYLGLRAREEFVSNKVGVRGMKRSMRIVQIVQSFAVGLVIAGCALPAFAADTPTSMNPSSSQSLKEISPSELKIAPSKPEASEPKQKESARQPATPAPAESRTPEAAAARAADPKDASGALIIKAPAGTGAKP